jgi:hypothetical protein
MQYKSVCVALAAAVAASGTAAQAATSTTKTIPKAPLIKRGDAISEKGSRRITLSPPSVEPTHPTPAQLRAAAPFLHQIAAVVGDEVRQVGALGTPDRDRATFERAIARSRVMVRWMRKEAAAAKAGDVRAFEKASANDSGEASARLLARFGFRVCGQ